MCLGGVWWSDADETPWEWRRECSSCQNIIAQVHRWKINNLFTFCDMRESKTETEVNWRSETGKGRELLREWSGNRVLISIICCSNALQLKLFSTLLKVPNPSSFFSTFLFYNLLQRFSKEHFNCDVTMHNANIFLLETQVHTNTFKH